MKRITILMMLLIALVMSSCGKESKEKVMESASEVDCQVFWRDISDNRALSDEKYMNKNLKMTMSVSDIASDYVEMYKGSMKVYLPKDNLVNLNDGDVITFAGKLVSIEEEKLDFGSRTCVTFKPAYLVDDVYEITGRITWDRVDDKGRQYFLLENTTVNNSALSCEEVSVFLPEEISDEFVIGDEITVLGKLSSEGDLGVIVADYYMYEAALKE